MILVTLERVLGCCTLVSEPHFRVVGQIDRGGERRRVKRWSLVVCVIARADGDNRTNINLRVAGSDHNKCQQHDACSLQDLSRTAGQNDIGSRWRWGEKARWAECGGPSSLTFFHLFSIKKKKKKSSSFFLATLFSFFLRTLRVVNLLASRTADKGKKNPPLPNRETTRLQAEENT